MNKKIISIILTIVMVMTMVMPIVMASVPTPTPPGNENKFGTMASTILGYVQWIGLAIAVGMLIYIGIKYVMASAGDKADLKSLLIKYVIGAVIIAAAPTILKWIIDIASGLSAGSGGSSPEFRHGSRRKYCSIVSFIS